MATDGIWNALNQALALIAKTSVNVYYAIPQDKVLVCRPLHKSQIVWLNFALVYLLFNGLACFVTLISLRNVNHTNISEHITTLMATLIILTLIWIEFFACWVLTFNTRAASSMLVLNFG